MAAVSLSAQGFIMTVSTDINVLNGFENVGFKREASKILTDK